MKNTYLDVIEKSLLGYPNIIDLANIDTTDDIQAYARITGIIAILVSNGRCPEYNEIAIRMLNVCINSIHPNNQLNDYAIKDIMISYKLLKNVVDSQQLLEWQKKLKEIKPYLHYVKVDRPEYKGELHNVNIYNMAAEHLRYTEGLTDSVEFISHHFEQQLNRFDETGLYHDPNDPMLYDLAARVQFLYLLGYGYNGEYKERLDGILKKGAITMLKMQSAANELPFGGRSSQFLFNEAFVCSIAEYEASRYKNEGDLKTAGMYKRCARLAIESISRWLEMNPPRNIKNFYPIESRIGTDVYGHYEKYMASLGMFLHLAIEFCDEDIKEEPYPAEKGGFVMELPLFHKIFANCGGYSMQFDTKADYNFESTGLGRIHAYGFPTELGLSLSFTKTPKYKIEGYGDDVAISAGWIKDGKVNWLSNRDNVIEYELVTIKEDEQEVIFKILYKVDNITIKELFTISKDGVQINASIEGAEEIYYIVPLFYTNGKDFSDISISKNSISVCCNEKAFNINADSKVEIDNRLMCNRNGEYKTAIIHKKGGQLKLKLWFEKVLSDG